MTKLTGMGLLVVALVGGAANCGDSKLADETSVKSAETSTSASAEKSLMERPAATIADDAKTSDSGTENKTTQAAK